MKDANAITPNPTPLPKEPATTGHSKIKFKILYTILCSKNTFTPQTTTETKPSIRRFCVLIIFNRHIVSLKYNKLLNNTSNAVDKRSSKALRIITIFSLQKS